LKAYHLTESDQNQAAIIFGRFNPPHFGHKAAWDIAAEFPIWYVGTNQSTQGPKDPLPFDIKIEAMKTFMPDIDDHLVAEQSWFTLASMVYKQHGAVTLHIVTDATDSKIFVPALQKQNGIEGPHGFYKFNNIVWKEAKRQSEASLVRKAVKDNNPQEFATYSGVPADTMIAGHPYFKLVRHYMMPYMQAEADKEKQKAERERLKAEKEQQKAEKLAMKQQPKAKGPAQELAETKRMSAAVKLQRAWDRERAKSSASNEREHMRRELQGIADRMKPKEEPKKDDQTLSEIKQRLDPKCWKGKHKEGTKIKGGVRVNNCVPNEGRVRIGQALESIYEAKARESLKKFEQDAIPGMTVYDSLNNSDSYTAYRFGVALAPSPDFTDMAKKSALANSFAMIDYTDADAKIRKGAEKSMGVKASSSSSASSKELPSTNKVSPIATAKRNKYGI